MLILLSEISKILMLVRLKASPLHNLQQSEQAFFKGASLIRRILVPASVAHMLTLQRTRLSTSTEVNEMPTNRTTLIHQ